MKYFDWNEDKNRKLKSERGIGIEQVVLALMGGDLLDILEHPNREQYPNQQLFIIAVEGYVFIVPFVEDEQTVFLKTIIPSRKMTKKYLGGQ